jgi:hypothetical protein
MQLGKFFSRKVYRATRIGSVSLCEWKGKRAEDVEKGEDVRRENDTFAALRNL